MQQYQRLPVAFFYKFKFILLFYLVIHGKSILSSLVAKIIVLPQKISSNQYKRMRFNTNIIAVTAEGASGWLLIYRFPNIINNKRN